MDIIDYLILFQYKESVLALIMLFGQETVSYAQQLGFIKIIDQVTYLNIH